MFLTDKKKPILVAGAGGFIGGHLVKSLLNQGYAYIRAVDIKPTDTWYQRFDTAENMSLDLKNIQNCETATEGMKGVYNLAADMGGMGFIENNRALCMLSSLINTHLLIASKNTPVERYFFSSSACVYAADKQMTPDNHGLKESDAYPAMPEDGYGWEKLFGERMCKAFYDDYGIETRVGRYHNIYGPIGTWAGGREKAPAAICRKVIEAKKSGHHEIEIWGDGKQTRSFMHIDDCVHSTQLLASSDIRSPLNLGSSEMVTIDQLVDIVEEIAGIKLKRKYNTNAPKGVRGRSSDNTLTASLLKWTPSVRLIEGMTDLYQWIDQQINEYVPDAA